MPASAKAAPVLVDTSAAVALVLTDHELHEAALASLRARPRGLAGHAAFETFSVLTRLPAPARLTAAAVTRLFAATFPETKFLSASAAASLLAQLGTAGISGGAVYDALVGASAKEHGLPLVTCDRRALDVYRALDVDVELLA
ncbi:type II toxin-antitoxin system VapC family toxin [Mycobacterium sp.]|uniref:type II toxin-antitoxin system VapC family toxin n=1 Tax=Mycobacterium sp. TaxID=1785 RepID=UPI002D9A14E7|nr:type II toxin-antitoxin system VapC family toxin [Mycobacterium sp.]